MHLSRSVLVALGILAASPSFADDRLTLTALPSLEVPKAPTADMMLVQFQYERGPYRRFERGPMRGPGRANRSTTIRELPNGCQIVTTRIRRWDGSVDVRRVRRC